MYKPSPLQISWAGCLASTGLQEIDYIIVDPHVVTSNFSNFFTEKPLILKDIWSILTCFEEVKISNQIPFYKNGFITFGSFNNLPKINENVIKIWSKILINVKDSKLRLIALPFKDDQVKKYFKKLFNLHGIKSERLIFDGDFSRKELFNNYNFIDIALDTYPYGGGTTTLEAAWMCVPTLTCAGDTFLSRCGKSINTNLGLNDWICENDEEYISKAIKFSCDPESLQKTKNFLLENKSQSKLFNSEIFVKNFSESLKKVWKDYANN
jgi:predicted O-linked N-acetylglucosamine transferase (SPINDLY family)